MRALNAARTHLPKRRLLLFGTVGVAAIVAACSVPVKPATVAAAPSEALPAYDPSTERVGGAAPLAWRDGPTNLDRHQADISVTQNMMLRSDRAAYEPVNTPNPVYPDSLQWAGVGGEVDVDATFDEQGRVVPGAIMILKATRPEFAYAVRAALLKSSWKPKVTAGKAVKQVVPLRYKFAATVTPWVLPPPANKISGGGDQ